MIYLDNAASTPLNEDVFQAMLPFLQNQFGNPSSIHRLGRLAHNGIEKARQQVAQLISAKPNEILFTSGGTESNNTAIFGITQQNKGKHIVTSSVEHDAILEPCKSLEKLGFNVTYLPVCKFGLIDLENLKNSISNETYLVSIMFANNEVGTIQPIKEISKICQEKNVLFHTDAIQAVGKIKIDVNDLGVDMLSISSHKINGPKGVGALYIRNGISVNPIIYGGGQEHGLRSGTENVANIVGFGQACQITNENFEKNVSHFEKLQKSLVSKILEEIPYVTLNGHPKDRTPNNVHLTFLGITGEDLIIKLDENGIAASTGSACSVNTQKASHVLQAMGFSHEQISGSLRLTIGTTNTLQDIETTIEILKKVVKELRLVSPQKAKYDFS